MVERELIFLKSFVKATNIVASHRLNSDAYNVNTRAKRCYIVDEKKNIILLKTFLELIS